MTPDEIVSKFLVALDNFEPITDQLSDSDLTRLREAIAPLLLQIPYDETGGVHNLIGIVRANQAYLKRYGCLLDVERVCRGPLARGPICPRRRRARTVSSPAVRGRMWRGQRAAPCVLP